VNVRDLVERRDRLPPAPVEHLEVVLRQPMNGVAFGVEHDHVEADQIRAGAKGGSLGKYRPDSDDGCQDADHGGSILSAS
jgi:hypothetical protein